MNNPNVSIEALYKTDQQGVVAALRRQVDGLVMPNLTVLHTLLLERKNNVRSEDQRLEIEQARLVSEAYAAAARLFTPELPVDGVDIPTVAPYLALPAKTGGHDEG